jgi:hypothetical protein
MIVAIERLIIPTTYGLIQRIKRRKSRPAQSKIRAVKKKVGYMSYEISWRWCQLPAADIEPVYWL